jgi:hypothetical protein
LVEASSSVVRVIKTPRPPLRRDGAGARLFENGSLREKMKHGVDLARKNKAGFTVIDAIFKVS